jgi:CheY-like chemotaxis protein
MDLFGKEPLSADRAQSAQPVTILLVDDNPEHRLLVIRNLRRGMRTVNIVECGSGSDCIARIGQTKFDLVLLDYSLRDMNGLEVLDVLKKIQDSMPIIMLTGREDDQIAEEAKRRGAADYIVKSTEFLDDIVAVVERTLAQRSD